MHHAVGLGVQMSVMYDIWLAVGPQPSQMMAVVCTCYIRQVNGGYTVML